MFFFSFFLSDVHIYGAVKMNEVHFVCEWFGKAWKCHAPVLICMCKFQSQFISGSWWHILMYFLAYLTWISVYPTGARKCRLTLGCKTALMHDVRMTILTFLRHFWRHFSAKRFDAKEDRRGTEPNRTEHFLIEKCNYFGVKLMKQYIFKSKCNCWRKSMQ